MVAVVVLVVAVVIAVVVAVVRALGVEGEGVDEGLAAPLGVAAQLAGAQGSGDAQQCNNDQLQTKSRS